MPDHLFILRLSGDFYTKARKTRLRFLRRLAGERRGRADLARHPAPAGEDLEPLLPRDAGGRGARPRCWPGSSACSRSREVERRPWADARRHRGRTGEALRARRVAGRRFAVRASRRGDREAIPLRLEAVESALGRALLAPAPAGVDLDDPGGDGAASRWSRGRPTSSSTRCAGRGGLPVGVEGRAVALVSGGFDSAVAAWLMLKRGVAARLPLLQPRRRPRTGSACCG